MYVSTIGNKTAAAEAVSNLAENQLMKFVSKAKLCGDKVVNDHTGKSEKLACLGIQADGTIVRLMETVHSVSAVFMTSNEKRPLHILTGAVGGVFHPILDYPSGEMKWDRSVEKYNETMMGYGNSNMVIVGYYLF